MVCNTSIHRFKSGLRLLKNTVFTVFFLICVAVRVA